MKENDINLTQTQAFPLDSCVLNTRLLDHCQNMRENTQTKLGIGHLKVKGVILVTVAAFFVTYVPLGTLYHPPPELPSEPQSTNLGTSSTFLLIGLFDP